MTMDINEIKKLADDLMKEQGPQIADKLKDKYGIKICIIAAGLAHFTSLIHDLRRTGQPQAEELASELSVVFSEVLSILMPVTDLISTLACSKELMSISNGLSSAAIETVKVMNEMKTETKQ